MQYELLTGRGNPPKCGKALSTACPLWVLAV
jgi:hypothetical protein